MLKLTVIDEPAGAASLKVEVTVFVQARPQTAFSHVSPVAQATAVPHWPHELHVTVPLPEHWIWPGVHTGAAGHEQLPHAQLALHVAAPYVLQVSVPFGAQTPCPVHVPSCHVPLTHVCVSVPQLPHDTGSVWPGAHTPLHVPLMHVWFGQVEVVCHMPPPLHVCALLPEHCFCPELHVPAHIPPTQVPLVHGTGFPYCPQAPHVSTPLPEHTGCCGVHTGADGHEHAPQAQVAVQVCVP
jgi:hypothetical protein